MDITTPDSISPDQAIKPASDRLAAASLTLALLGWVIYLLQWCFDLTLGLILALATAGAGAICSSVLDVLPFLLWMAGIITGHASLARIGATGDSGRGRAVGALVLNYLGLFFTFLLVILIIILIVSGVHTGWLEKIFPFIHR